MLEPEKDEMSSKFRILGDDPVHKPHPAIWRKMWHLWFEFRTCRVLMPAGKLAVLSKGLMGLLSTSSEMLE